YFQAAVPVVPGAHAELDGTPIGVAFPLGAVDPLLENAEEQDHRTAGAEARRVPREGAAKDLEVPQVVMGDLVSDAARHRCIVRAAVEHAPGVAVVAAGRRDRRACRQPRNVYVETPVDPPLSLQSGRYAFVRL